MSAPGARLKLTNSLPQTTTWIYFQEDGRLTVEWYDYSDEAENHLGGDVAFLLHIEESGQRQIGALLENTDPEMPGDQSDKTLLQRLQQRFGSYQEIKSWLVTHAIPFEAEFDGNA